jgi:hypothetical protein
MKDTWELERVVIGLRHKRTFQATNKISDFLDSVIPLQGNYPFPEKSFTVVGHPDNLSVDIRDDEGTLSVIYGTDGLTLNCDMSAEPRIDISTVEDMFMELSKIAIPLTEGKNKIDRMGVVFQYRISAFENSAKEIFSKVLKVNMKGTPDNVVIRFALKNPTSDAIYKPDKKADYRNAFVEMISTREVRKESDEELSFPTVIKLATDYQYYYVPLRTFADIKINAHVAEAQSYIENNIRANFNFEVLQKTL